MADHRAVTVIELAFLPGAVPVTGCASAGTIMLPGCGHWTQQEPAKEVNTAMIDFLGGF